MGRIRVFLICVTIALIIAALGTGHDGRKLAPAPTLKPSLADIEDATTSPTPALSATSAATAKPSANNSMTRFEEFLNAPGAEAKLVSRFIFERLEKSNIRFADVPGVVFGLRLKNDLYHVEKSEENLAEAFEINDSKIKRWSDLFFGSKWEQAGEIPRERRYRWLLEDAKFFLSRYFGGSDFTNAKNLDRIDEHFYVLFRSPKERDLSSGFSADDIWSGDGSNGNAVSTVLKHPHSVSVTSGVFGPTPKSAWILDDLSLDKIALSPRSSDTPADIGDIRAQGEKTFALFLPVSARAKTVAYWNKGSKHNLKLTSAELTRPVSMDYSKNVTGAAARREFFEAIFDKAFPSSVRGPKDEINSDWKKTVEPIAPKIESVADFEIELSKVTAHRAELLPLARFIDDVARLEITSMNDTVTYTLLRHRDEDPKQESLFAARGIVSNEKPSHVFKVDLASSANYLRALQSLKTSAQAEALVDQNALKNP